MKESARTTESSVSFILSEGLASTSDSVAQRMTCKNSIKRTLRRTRTNSIDDIPCDLENLCVPEAFQVTSSNHRFLL